MELSLLKEYIQVEHDLDDSVIKMLESTAKAYINGAIEYVNENDPRYDMAVALLVGHWYENRLASVETALNEIPFGVLPLIQQLRGVVM